MTSSARLVGLDPAAVPSSVSELHGYYSEVRPALKVTPVARRNVLWSFVPPMPRKVALLTPARPAWIGLLTLASAMLPAWARRLYGLPGIPSTDLTATVLGRSLRGALAVVPQDLIRSPAHREALSRVRAAA
jgi:uncharacterized protein (DUF2236 family)